MYSPWRNSRCSSMERRSQIRANRTTWDQNIGYDDRTKETPRIWKGHVALPQRRIALEGVVVAVAHREDDLSDIKRNRPDQVSAKCTSASAAIVTASIRFSRQ
jgi:hypothetical protein